jgi:hypothetical protein
MGKKQRANGRSGDGLRVAASAVLRGGFRGVCSRMGSFARPAQGSHGGRGSGTWRSSRSSGGVGRRGVAGGVWQAGRALASFSEVYSKNR